MAKLVLITGGARSGKSTLAEEMAKKSGEKVLYVATAKAVDTEMLERIAIHKAQRPSQWETYEGYKNLGGALADKLTDLDAVLLDCVTIWVSNLMLDREFEWDNLTRERVTQIENEIKNEVEALISLAQQKDTTFILVTNEVGLGVVPPYAMGRDFRDIAGRINQIIANAADEVYFCVSGIPWRLK